MKLPKRLDEIQKLIDDNVVVIDIGCDHALLDIYLTLNRENVKCLACDINKNALSIANKNIQKYHLEDRIQTFLCDGLGDFELDDKSIIVIAGMGTMTIKHILNDKRIYSVKKIILQSNTDHKSLRKYMTSIGFNITDEKIVCDRDKDYVIMVFEKGKIKYNNYELEYGPIILKNKDKYTEYFIKEKTKLKKIYRNIPLKHWKLKLQTLKKIMYLTKGKK